MKTLSGPATIAAFVSGAIPAATTRNGSVYFKDDLIYSYGTHYCIAYFDRAARLVTFNCSTPYASTGKVSVTTKKHMTALAHAFEEKGVTRTHNVKDPVEFAAFAKVLDRNGGW